MKRLSRLAAAAGLAAICVGGGWAGVGIAADTKPAAGATPAEVTGADAHLAEAFSDLARRAVMQQELVPSMWRESQALAEAAFRLNPREPRVAKYLAETAGRTGDVDAAIEALKAVLAAEPQNRGAQVGLIDLYASRMDTADARAAYFKDVMGKNTLPEDVRSVAAVRLAKVMLERSQREEATVYVNQSLRLNPLNVEALTLRHHLLQAKGTPLEKTGALLALLRANPCQSNALWSLARQASDAGLVKDSTRWYQAAINVAARSGQQVPPPLVADFVSAVYVSGDTNNSMKMLDQALKADDNRLPLWLLKYTIQKDVGDKGADESLSRAVVAAYNQVASLRQQAGDTTATTRPVDSAEPLAFPPDTSADLQRIQADQSGQLRAAYAQAAAEWAWLEIYFAKRPNDAAKIMEFLRAVLPADDVALARLEGWSLLNSGKPDEAKVKLSAVADRDPLSAMGVLQINAAADPAAKDRTASEARKLVSEHASGLVGAILYAGLKGEGVTLIAGNNAEAIGEELKKFPAELLGLIDQPQGFYGVRIDPVKVSNNFGEPLLVRVTVQNLSSYDLSVGPDGAIKPEIAFDVLQRGIGNAGFPVVNVARFQQVLVLKARTTVSQVMRLDHGPLAIFLSRQPGSTLQFSVYGTSNPVFSQRGVFPGAGGYRVQMPRVIERAGGTILTDAGRSKIGAALSGKDLGDKVRAIELMAAWAQIIRAEPKAPEQAKKIADELEQQIVNAGADESDTIKAASAFGRAMVLPTPEETLAALKRLAEEKDWRKQLLAAVGGQSWPADQQKPLLEQVAANASEPFVKEYAAARIETIAAVPPATQPAGGAEAGAAAPAPAAAPAEATKP